MPQDSAPPRRSLRVWWYSAQNRESSGCLLLLWLFGGGSTIAKLITEYLLNNVLDLGRDDAILAWTVGIATWVACIAAGAFLLVALNHLLHEAPDPINRVGPTVLIALLFLLVIVVGVWQGQDEEP